MMKKKKQMTNVNLTTKLFEIQYLLGDVVAIYRKTDGLRVASYSYTAWGVTTVTNYTADGIGDWNPWRWRGKYQDQETGFYYMQSRFYDPVIGRFINADDPRVLPIESLMPNGANLFMYCYNNPVMFRDDTGYGFFTSLILVGILVGFAIAGAVTGAVVAYRNDQNPIAGFFMGFGLGLVAGGFVIVTWGAGATILFGAKATIGTLTAMQIAAVGMISVAGGTVVAGVSGSFLGYDIRLQGSSGPRPRGNFQRDIQGLRPQDFRLQRNMPFYLIF